MALVISALLPEVCENTLKHILHHCSEELIGDFFNIRHRNAALTFTGENQGPSLRRGTIGRKSFLRRSSATFTIL